MAKRVNRDHATAIHGIKIFDNELIKVPQLLDAYQTIKIHSNEYLDCEVVEHDSIEITQLKNRIRDLSFELSQSKKKLSEYNKIGYFDSLIKQIPDDKKQVAYIRIEAMVNMLNC